MKQEIQTKYCPFCKKFKPLTEFNKCKHRKFGVKEYCRICQHIKSHQHYEKHKTEIIKKHQKYQSLHIKEIQIYHQEWYKENKDKVIQQGNINRKKQILNDPNCKLKYYLRSNTRRLFKNQTKSSSTLNILGCSWDFIYNYIQQQLPNGLTMNDYGNKKGQWTLDHIIPCSFFILTNPTELKQCGHYTNLRPLLHTDNMKKGNKTDGLKLLFNDITPFI